MLNKYDVEYIIRCLEEGLPIPHEYKYELFPTSQKEYELAYSGKMRIEDILSDTDEISNVPLQVERRFNAPDNENSSNSETWDNLLIFGDNLQILKTFFYNKDPLIVGKVKEKVKLIYIDPPFATEQEFNSNQGQKAYADKVKGAEFVEFLRRRLVLLKEMMTPDGFICVHLDYRKKHYIKVIMDEVFRESNFKNEIAVNRVKKNIRERIKVKKLNEEFDTILVYSRSEEALLLPPTRMEFKGDIWHSFDAPGFRNGMDYELFGFCPSTTTHWRWESKKAFEAVKNYENWLKYFSDSETLGEYWNRTGKKLKFIRPNSNTGKPEYFIPETEQTLCNNLWNDLSAYSFANGYPTEKNELFLKRIIEMTTDPGDLVMDCFAGSGTALAAAEKLGRRWIGCDIGKFSLYTIQKRLLKINESNDLINPKKKFKKQASSFTVVTAGLYDLGKVFSLTEDEYKSFVKNLFDIEDIANTQINGVTVDGEKRGYFVKIYPYWNEEFRNADVDASYIENLHKHIGSRIKGRFYIVAPANSVAFINDYYEIDKVRYYFLKIPYQVIHELHNMNFKKLKQPQSSKQINDLEEAVGFHFIRQPEVCSKLVEKEDQMYIELSKFMSDYDFDENGNKINNFESLSMVLVDNSYQGKFIMTNHYFAKDLLGGPKSKKTKNEDETINVREKLKNTKKIMIPINPIGKRIMVIYVDIYGNEFKETFELGD